MPILSRPRYIHEYALKRRPLPWAHTQWLVSNRAQNSFLATELLARAQTCTPAELASVHVCAHAIKVPVGSKVLDIGAGPGEPTTTMARRLPKHNFVLTDKQEGMVEKAQKRSDGLRHDPCVLVLSTSWIFELCLLALSCCSS